MTDLNTGGANRRTFLKGSAALAGATALTGFETLGRRSAECGEAAARSSAWTAPPGPRPHHRKGLIALPRGFEYLTFGRTGELMDDGIPTPGAHDGMAAFRDGDVVRLVRNHESGAGPAFAAGMTYDTGPTGGTTTLVFDPDAGALVGRTPAWPARSATAPAAPPPGDHGSRARRPPSSTATTRHGYVFEVPADGTSNGEPLDGMGRFSHEAAAVDPATGNVYLTEDATPSGLYRFVPATKGNLSAGGQLQMLAIGEAPMQTYTDAGAQGLRHGVLGGHRRSPTRRPAHRAPCSRVSPKAEPASSVAKASGTATDASTSSPPAAARPAARCSSWTPRPTGSG